MWFSSWLTALRVPTQPQRSRRGKRTSPRRSPQTRRLVVEGLEDRRLLTFLPAVSNPTGVDSPGAVVTADFNNDGQLDLAIASNRYDPDALVYIGTVSVLLGNADGTVSIGDATKREGRNGKTTLLTFTVTLSVPYDQPVTMSFQTVNGTATTSDNDYVAKTGTLTFAPGETTKTITIVVKGDSKKEASETFYLDLFGLSSNAPFTKNRGIGSILNDD